MTYCIDPSARIVRTPTTTAQRFPLPNQLCLANGIMQPAMPSRRPEWFDALRQVASDKISQLFLLESKPALAFVSLSPETGSNRIIVCGPPDQMCDPQAITELARITNLTSREEQVLKLLAAGLSPKEIASHQHIAISTVRSQIKAVFAKSGRSSIREVLHLLSRLPPMAQSASAQSNHEGPLIRPAPDSCSCINCQFSENESASNGAMMLRSDLPTPQVLQSERIKSKMRSQ